MELLVKDSYLHMVRQSIGSTMFRNLYAQINGESQDILKDGDLSCAYFVSTILHHFKLIASPHATVSGTVKDLEKSGWQKIEAPIVGAVVVWEKASQAGDEPHEHIGFVSGDSKAISNSYIERVPVEHDLTFGGTRKITAIYANDFLGK